VTDELNVASDAAIRGLGGEERPAWHSASGPPDERSGSATAFGDRRAVLLRVCAQCNHSGTHPSEDHESLG